MRTARRGESGKQPNGSGDIWRDKQMLRNDSLVLNSPPSPRNVCNALYFTQEQFSDYFRVN